MTESPVSLLPPEVRLEYPFAGNSFEVAGVGGQAPARMHYVDEGQGPVVLLLHGNPTWSFYFRNLILKLKAAGFRCIAPDHIGCGLSDKPQDYPYTLARRIEDIERLVDHLDLDTFHLVVHDWGGAIGCGLASRRPAALGRLVVLNTAAFPSRRIPLRIAAVKVPLFGEWVIRGLNGFARPALNMAVRVPLPPAARRGMLWPYGSWRDRVAVWHFVKDIPLRRGHPSYATLAGVEAGLTALRDKPVQILWGERDFCFNRHFLERWQRLFPEADLRLFPDCGHYVLEDGRDAANEAILRFLTP